MISERISDKFTSPSENFEYGYHHSYAHLHLAVIAQIGMLHKVACHPRKCDIINDIKLFPIV